MPWDFNCNHRGLRHLHFSIVNLFYYDNIIIYNAQIVASEVDFYDINGFGYLRYLEEEDDYPPRFAIEVDGSSATKADVLCVSFKGAMEEIKLEKILTVLHKRLSGMAVST